MAGHSNSDIAKLVVDNYAPLECIDFCLKMHMIAKDNLRIAIEKDNVGYVGRAEQKYQLAEAVLEALESKLSGGTSGKQQVVL